MRTVYAAVFVAMHACTISFAISTAGQPYQDALVERAKLEAKLANGTNATNETGAMLTPSRSAKMRILAMASERDESASRAASLAEGAAAAEATMPPARATPTRAKVEGDEEAASSEDDGATAAAASIVR